MMSPLRWTWLDSLLKRTPVVDSEILFQIRKAQYMEKRMLKPEVRPPIGGLDRPTIVLPIMMGMALCCMTSYMLGRRSIECAVSPPPPGSVCVSEDPDVDSYAVMSDSGNFTVDIGPVEVEHEVATYSIVGCTSLALIDHARLVAQSGDLFVAPECPLYGQQIHRVFVNGIQVWPLMPAEYSAWVTLGRFELRVPR